MSSLDYRQNFYLILPTRATHRGVRYGAHEPKVFV